MTDDRRRALLGDPLTIALATLIDRAVLTDDQVQALGDYSALLIDRCTTMAVSAITPLWAQVEAMWAQLDALQAQVAALPTAQGGDD